MAKALVIVESPAKAKTIKKYLGNQFVVKASLGHIKDLPKKDLAVDVENGFKPRYEIIEGKKKLIGELRQAAKKVDEIYLAADPDREGEAICFHLQEELGNGNKGPRVYRVMFNEITKKAIEKAFKTPGQVDLRLVEAQQARRVLDRLVGYKISPLLWDKVRRGLSAGRVQTIALRLIVEREREIRAFVAREYWTIDADLAAKKPPHITARLAKVNDQNAEVASQEAADGILAELEGADYAVRSVGTREKRRNPVAPFITSTLQQEASRKLRFSVKRTMMLAQKLYEGVEAGKEGSVGLITYMRTDSTRVSHDALEEVRQIITERYGRDFLPRLPTFYKSKKDAQDAHEAIRPTSMAFTPDEVEKYLAEDEMKLYRLIWMRFVASQMMPALFDQTTIDVAARGKSGADYMFRATGSTSEIRRLPQGLSGRQGPDRRRRRGAEAPSARCHRGRGAAPARAQSRTALYGAASAIQRSDAGEDARSRRHRPSIDLRIHPFHHSGTRVRQEGRRPLPSHRIGHGGDRPAARKLRRYLRRYLHGADGGRARRNRRGQD